jgi:choloylglycine hydrolase
LAAVLAATPAQACSIFFATRDGAVLAGNNEDFYLDVIPRMWVKACGAGEHGRITFGFGPEDSRPFAQGGVNSAGLFFDAAVTPRVGKPQRGKPEPPDDMGDAMLAACGTVDEAIAWLERHDLRLLTGSHFLLGDKTGKGGVLELVDRETKVIPSGKNYIAATNFSFTKPEAGNFPCPRFETIRAALGDATPDPDVSVAGFQALLASVAVPPTDIEAENRRGGTLYSNIYDLTNGTITVYRESQWDAPLTIDVAEWLARGDAAHLLDDLFAASPDKPLP